MGDGYTFDVQDILRKLMFPEGYDRSEIEPFEVEVKLPPLMAMFEDMVSLTMIEAGYKIKDSSPYLIKDNKWWIADLDEEMTAVIIQYGDDKQQRGYKRIPFDSPEEAMASLTKRVSKKFDEGYLMGKRRRITWDIPDEDIDTP